MKLVTKLFHYLYLMTCLLHLKCFRYSSVFRPYMHPFRLTLHIYHSLVSLSPILFALVYRSTSIGLLSVSVVLVDASSLYVCLFSSPFPLLFVQLSSPLTSPSSPSFSLLSFLLLPPPPYPPPRRRLRYQRRLTNEGDRLALLPKNGRFNFLFR